MVFKKKINITKQLEWWNSLPHYPLILADFLYAQPRIASCRQCPEIEPSSSPHVAVAYLAMVTNN